MNSKSRYLIVICLFLLACSYTEELQIAGMWIIDNSPDGYRGTKTFEIIKGNDDKYYIDVNSAIRVEAIFDKNTNAVFFQIVGYGPDGPKEKLLLKDRKLIRYTLINGEWVKGYSYRRAK